MSSNLIAALHQEERTIVAELRASRPFMRLEGIRRLLEMYDAQPSVNLGLELASAGAADRTSASVVQLGAPPPAAPVVAAQAIPMPGPVASSPDAAPVAAEGATAVVSSVRAALLGIGKA